MDNCLSKFISLTDNNRQILLSIFEKLKTKKGRKLVEFFKLIDNCDVSSYFIGEETNLQGESGSFVGLGTIEVGLDTIEVALKLIIVPSYKVYNAHLVEFQIYKYIVPVLLNYTPHLVRFIGGKVVEDNCKLTNKIINSLDIKAKRKINRPIQIEITEKFGISFDDMFFSEEEESDKDLLLCVFQILYTLLCFYRAGIKHNDLHTRNILVEDTKETLRYNINGRTIETKPKVFL